MDYENFARASCVRGDEISRRSSLQDAAGAGLSGGAMSDGLYSGSWGIGVLWRRGHIYVREIRHELTVDMIYHPNCDCDFPVRLVDKLVMYAD